MIQHHVDKDQTGTVKQKITHDFVLDVYEKSLSEKDPEAKKAIVETAKVLSKNIGQYLVDMEKD